MGAPYHNLDPEHRPHGARAILRWGLWDPLRGRRKVSPPGLPAPRVEADLELIREPSDRPRLTWIGHASFLGSLAGSQFLIDPVLSGRIGVVYPRYLPAALQVPDLPALDVVLVTHNHYDHLDAATLRRLPRGATVVVPEGLGVWFRRRRWKRVCELHWWETIAVGDLEVTLVPSRHWSRRRILDTNRSLWGGFVVRGGGTAVYHAGDSAWFEGFAEIGARFPDLVAAMLPIGGYEPPWFMEANHLNPEQAGRAFLRLGAERLVPMHWGSYQLTDEPLAEPAARLAAWWRRHGLPEGRLARLAVGETLLLR